MDKDNSVESLSPDLDKSLRHLIRELFSASKLEAPRQNDPEFAKLENMSPLVMLSEVEQMVHQHLEVIDEFKNSHKDDYNKMKKALRDQEKEENQKEKRDKEEMQREQDKINRELQELMRKGK